MFDYEKKRIISKKRTIKKSRHLEVPELQREGFESLCKDIEEGKDLKIYQSKNLYKPSFKDTLLYDWNIQHLHLGFNKKDGKPVDRIKNLLFATFTDQNAYLIDIQPHGSWTSLQLIRIIHDEWPDIIASSRIEGFIALETNPSEEEIKAFRKHGIMYAFEPYPGKFYFPPGGGLTTASTSVDVTDKMIRMIHRIRNLKSHINSFEKEISKLFEKETLSEKIELRIVYFNSYEFILLETNTRKLLVI